MLFGDSGIITMAQKAADETNKAAEKDQADLAELDKYLTSGNWGGATDPENPPKEHVNPTKGEKVPVQADGKTNVEWKETIKEGESEKKLTAKIPVGFCVVKDLKDAEGNITDENNITNGLVISDVANDDLDNTAGGNQFVWIPVEDFNKFVRIEGFSDDSRDSMLADCQEAGKEGDSVSTEESITMYRSVADNNGFYIARFEAGIKGKNSLTDESGNTYVPTEEDKQQKPVSIKGVAPWNCIPWGGTEEKEASDGFEGNEECYGAVKVARSMYPKEEAFGASSSLCYGVQWDAMMQFIDPNYFWKSGETDNVASDSFVKYDTDDVGGFSHAYLTGENDKDHIKHIYDLAGDVREWTMERGTYFNHGIQFR